jgi:hypothetical protein
MAIYKPTPARNAAFGAIMIPRTASAPTATQPAVAPTPVPNAPAAPALAQGTGTDLTVTWAAPATDSAHGAATSFNLRSSPSGAGTWTLVGSVTSPYALTGLAPGAAIDVQVQAANATGTGAWSATSTATTAPGAPNAPAAPILTQGAGSTLTVIWLSPATDAAHGAATSFNLRSSPSGAGTWTVVTGVASPFALTGLPASSATDVEVQAVNAAGTSAWSVAATMTTAAAGPYAPNAPVIASAAPPPDGTVTKLAVTWAAPATDGTHGAATGYNLRYSPSGAGTWTVMSGVSSPVTVTGLSGATAYDVQVQGTDAATSPGAWSATVTGTTWGSTVAQGGWTPASTQVHGTGVAPNGGVQMIATAAPTAVTAGAFAWSASQTAMPTTGLTAAGADGQSNGYGAYMNAPATAGTFYLWMMAQGAGGAVTGALVSVAITVS